MIYGISGKRIGTIRDFRWRYVRLLLGLVGAIAGVIPLQAASVFWGAEASGRARQFEITCSTCPNPVTELSNLSDGGLGQKLGVVEFGTADVAYDAKAIFAGPNSLPHLSVLASGGITIVPPSTFFHSATTVARATEEYEYIGSTSTDYTLEYDVNGAVSGGILTEIAGGFTVFGSGFNPNQEVQPVLGFTFDHANGDGTEKPVHFNGSVTFTVNPGDTIFVQSTLDAFVDSRSQQLPAVADAAHTLDMSFTKGDTSLLIPAVTPDSNVPEPVTTALFGIGLAGVGLALRRRRRTG